MPETTAVEARPGQRGGSRSTPRAEQVTASQADAHGDDVEPGTGGRTRTVLVALPHGMRADWIRISQILTYLGLPACVPLAAFPVRRRPILGWFSRWSARHLLDVVRRRGAVTHAAAGRRSRLDLHRSATAARRQATARWWAWHAHIARTTPPARPWADWLAEHRRDPKKLPLAEARRRFESQHRVLAMLAYNSYPAAPHRFDLDELAAYQAGEAVYVALHWQHAITGDAVVTPEGRLLQPLSDSPADRLRYLAHATRVIHDLAPGQYLVAVKAAAAP